MSELKIYIVERNDEVGWDEYISAVVVALDKEDAVEILKQKHVDRGRTFSEWGNWDVSIREVTTDERSIVVESFNAG